LLARVTAGSAYQGSALARDGTSSPPEPLITECAGQRWSSRVPSARDSLGLACPSRLGSLAGWGPGTANRQQYGTCPSFLSFSSSISLEVPAGGPARLTGWGPWPSVGTAANGHPGRAITPCMHTHTQEERSPHPKGLLEMDGPKVLPPSLPPSLLHAERPRRHGQGSGCASLPLECGHGATAPNTRLECPSLLVCGRVCGVSAAHIQKTDRHPLHVAVPTYSAHSMSTCKEPIVPCAHTRTDRVSSRAFAATYWRFYFAADAAASQYG
jgi:hypothetical protein